GDTVLDHTYRSTPTVPEQGVEVGHVHDRYVRAVGQGVFCVGYLSPRGVVLDVDGRNVPSWGPAQQLLRQVELVWSLKHHQVDLEVVELLRRDFHGAARPLPGACPSPSVGPSVRGE